MEIIVYKMFSLLRFIHIVVPIIAGLIIVGLPIISFFLDNEN